MPAPRLLDKKLVTAALATERKQEIDKGIKLAKSIDALRETRVKEESELQDFRINTIRKIQIEIDAKIEENDRLSSENKLLREQRILAEAPIDLKEEWQKVREDKQTFSSWQESLTQQSIELLAREQDSQVLSEELKRGIVSVSEQLALAKRTLESAEQKYILADEALERAERQAQEILRDAQQRENHLRVREEDATNREIFLSKREVLVDAHEVDLSNREQKLKSRQELFIKAQAYIKSKK